MRPGRIRVASLLFAAAAAGGLAVVPEVAEASSPTETLTKSDSQSCQLELADLGKITYTQGFTVTVDAPTEAVEGVPTERIPYRGTASTSLDLSQGAPLRTALASVGATSLDIAVSIGVAYYGSNLPDPATSPHWSVTGIPLVGEVATSAAGAGTLAPMLFAEAGTRTGLMYASSFSVTITPHKADGTATAYGTLAGLCVSQPWFQEWSRVDVLPRMLHREFGARMVTHLANAVDDIAFEGGTFALDADRATGTFSAALTVSGERRVSFRFLHLLPATAVVRLSSPGRVTGRAQGTDVSVTVPLDLDLTELSLFGVPVPRAGEICRSATSADLTGRGFSFAHGGVLTGTYSLPPFRGCGFAAGEADLLLSAHANTMALSLASG